MDWVKGSTTDCILDMHVVANSSGNYYQYQLEN